MALKNEERARNEECEVGVPMGKRDGLASCTCVYIYKTIFLINHIMNQITIIGPLNYLFLKSIKLIAAVRQFRD